MLLDILFLFISVSIIFMSLMEPEWEIGELRAFGCGHQSIEKSGLKLRWCQQLLVFHEDTPHVSLTIAVLYAMLRRSAAGLLR